MAPVLALWKYAGNNPVAAYLRSMSPRTARTSEVTSLQIPGLQDLADVLHGGEQADEKGDRVQTRLNFPTEQQKALLTRGHYNFIPI